MSAAPRNLEAPGSPGARERPPSPSVDVLGVRSRARRSALVLAGLVVVVTIIRRRADELKGDLPPLDADFPDKE